MFLICCMITHLQFWPPSVSSGSKSSCSLGALVPTNDFGLFVCHQVVSGVVPQQHRCPFMILASCVPSVCKWCCSSAALVPTHDFGLFVFHQSVSGLFHIYIIVCLILSNICTYRMYVMVISIIFSLTSEVVPFVSY